MGVAGGAHAKLVIGDVDCVADAQLAPAPCLGLAVDGHGLRGEQRLDLAAAVDDPGELEQLPEPDGLAPYRYLARHCGRI